MKLNKSNITKRQQITDLVVALKDELYMISLEELARLHGKKEMFVQEFSNLVAKLGKHEPVVLVAPPVHETIRIPCTIGNRNYLACGFLKAGELTVRGDVMLDRTKVEGTTAIDDSEEWQHLYELRAEFDKYPELKEYYLATERRDTVDPRDLLCFGRGDQSQKWYEVSYSVVSLRGRNSLVLRRCP